MAHNAMYSMWLADCFFVPYSQVAVDDIPHLCIAERIQLTAILSLLSFIQALENTYKLLTSNKQACK